MVASRVLFTVAPLLGVGQALTLSLDQSLEEDAAPTQKKAMSSKECQTMCQRFAFPMLAEYSSDFKAISHPTECVGKCKELTPSVFKTDAASLLQTEPLTKEEDKSSHLEKKTETKALKKTMSSKQCQTMCQRFGMPALKEYDESFGKITHPPECVDKCKELTPKVFSADDKGTSFLQSHGSEPAKTGSEPAKAGAAEPAKTESKEQKKTKVECKTLCQRFAADSVLAKTDPAFKGLDPTKCVAQCDKSEHFG